MCRIIIKNMKLIEGMVNILMFLFKTFSGSNENDSPYGEWLKDNGYEI